jgi:hypothetical protein
MSKVRAVMFRGGPGVGEDRHAWWRSRAGGPLASMDRHQLAARSSRLIELTANPVFEVMIDVDGGSQAATPGRVVAAP